MGKKMLRVCTREVQGGAHAERRAARKTRRSRRAYRDEAISSAKRMLVRQAKESMSAKALFQPLQLQARLDGEDAQVTWTLGLVGVNEVAK